MEQLDGMHCKQVGVAKCAIVASDLLFVAPVVADVKVASLRSTIVVFCHCTNQPFERTHSRTSRTQNLGALVCTPAQVGWSQVEI